MKSFFLLKKTISLFLLFSFSFPISSIAEECPLNNNGTKELGLVVSDRTLASKVGLEILKKGGNAIDAAVAVGYALAVLEPCCGNLGGGGFMTIHFANGKNIFINFREKAPEAVNENRYNILKNKNPKNKAQKTSTLQGYLSVTVPGTVLGLNTALERYGTLSRETVMDPAIELAENGYILTPGDVKLLTEYTETFRKEPNVAAIFLKNNKPYQIGERLIQSDLAKTLKTISEQGSQAFYFGHIAKTIVAASKENGGILTLEDFKHYTIEELKPIECSYRGLKVLSSPPPSSGGTMLCEMLTILEDYPLEQYGFHSTQSTHVITEAMRYAFLDRNLLGDPHFTKNPVELLISKAHAKTIRQHINEKRVTPSIELENSAVRYQKEGHDTTHFSIIDKEGTAVAVTYSLNSAFGAKVIAKNTGFFLNNHMDDFTVESETQNQFGLKQGNANAIEPGKRPLSSMTPTIVLKNDKPFLILGAAGGPHIITATLLTLINSVDYHMPIQEAVNAPRFHHQFLPDEIKAEPDAFSKAITQDLESMGYRITPIDHLGIEEAIMIPSDSSIIYGGKDRRDPAGKDLGCCR